MEKSKQDYSIAVIGGIFVIVAAFIGGFFLIINTLIDKGIDASLNPQVQIVITATAITSAGNNTNTSCPSLSLEQIDYIRNEQDVESAIQQAEKFAGNLQHDYKEGETIPVNVVIASNLQASPSNFPVVPIKNENGSGVFLTLESFVAPYDGTYWCVQQ